MINRNYFKLFISLFSFFICVTVQASEIEVNKTTQENDQTKLENKNVNSESSNQNQEEEKLDPKLKEQAEFSCLKYAGIRLGSPNGIIITQIKGPQDNNNLWMVVGNKLNNEDEERPVSFSCRLVQDDGAFLWPLNDFSLFQITEDSVQQMKNLQKEQLKEQAQEQKKNTTP